MEIGLLDVFWVLVYIISFFGSLSFGYLVLRFNIPDIRIIPREAKLGLSGIIGAIIFGLSMGVAYFLGVNFLIFLPIWTLVFTGLFEIQQTFFANKEVTVVIPVAKMEQPKPVERRVEVRPSMSPPKVLEERAISERGAFVRESYPRGEEKLIIEKREEEQAPVEEKPEIVPEKEEEYIKTARERFKERMEQKRREEEERQREEQARGEMTRAEAETRAVPQGRPMEEARGRERYAERREAEAAPEVSDRRRKYMERRGEMLEEAKTDMFRASDKKERDKYEKELFKESAPAAEISIEELSKGLDVEDLEKIGSIDELGDLELGELGGMTDKDLETLAGMTKRGDLAGVAEAEKIPKQKGLVCPNCGSGKSTIVYCPYCGKGFCSNCSDKVERKGELIFYGCPSCKKDVIVKSES